MGQCGGRVVSNDASQLEDSWFKPTVEFARSPRVCVSILQVLWLPPIDMHVTLIDYSKLAVGVDGFHVPSCYRLTACPRCTLHLAI